MPAVLGVGAYFIGRAAGWHPEALGLVVMVAGFLFASGVGSVLRAVTRKSGDVPASRHGGPVYQALPEAAPEVVILVEQGRKIQAIKRYRKLNPGIGLKQGKDVIDGLQPAKDTPFLTRRHVGRVLSSDAAADPEGTP
jgi:hypothetical protein